MTSYDRLLSYVKLLRRSVLRFKSDRLTLFFLLCAFYVYVYVCVCVYMYTYLPLL